MPLADFTVLSTLGKGSYSEVFKVTRKSDGVCYALKKVSLEGLSHKERENALNEVRILASIRHSNIIGYKESFVQEKTLFIVMDYASDGDLYQKILRYKKYGETFGEEYVWRVVIGSLQALARFHNSKVFHRDIKSANIFLTKSGTALLGDLNVSKVAKQGLLYTQTGTPYYASPEVWKD
jgi:NIMA (never in mitosis gene a)-related kinase